MRHPKSHPPAAFTQFGPIIRQDLPLSSQLPWNPAEATPTLHFEAVTFFVEVDGAKKYGDLLKSVF
jgi:hypothetical protein